MDMVKGTFHPNAFLSQIKNIRRGLRTRTKILNALEKSPADAKHVVVEAGVGYSVVMHHLRLLTVEGIVQRKGDKRPYSWDVTGMGQRRLADSS